LSVKERGPVRLLYKLAANPNWLVLDDAAWTKVLDGTLHSIAWAIDVNTFMRKHLTMFSMEAMQSDTTFEFQYICHYEGIPSSES